MRRSGSVLLALIFTLSFLAAAEEWEKDYTAVGKPMVRVNANDAEIRVMNWERKEIEARVITEGYKLGPGDVRVTENQTGDQITLDVHTPPTVGVNLHHRSVRVEIDMPSAGDLTLHTGDGNIRVENIKGELRLDSGDGNLDIRAGDGNLEAATRDGNVSALGRFETLNVRTGDGNIDAEANDGSRISSAWVLRTEDGNLALRIPRSLSADVDAQTGDGHVSIDLPMTVNGNLKENSVRGKINGGGPAIELRSGDGNIQVRGD